MLPKILSICSFWLKFCFLSKCEKQTSTLTSTKKNVSSGSIKEIQLQISVYSSFVNFNMFVKETKWKINQFTHLHACTDILYSYMLHTCPKSIPIPWFCRKKRKEKSKIKHISFIYFPCTCFFFTMFCLFVYFYSPVLQS